MIVVRSFHDSPVYHRTRSMHDSGLHGRHLRASGRDGTSLGTRNTMATITNRGGAAERRLLVCDCEGTMRPDPAALASGLGANGEIKVHTQLCRRQIDQFQNALAGDAPLLVACTQEAPLFSELAEEEGRDLPAFVNIRERAGWCENAGSPDPNVQAKMVALIADALYETKPTGAMTVRSEGQCLVYGAGQQTLDVAAQLADRLSVTVVLIDAADVIPPSVVNVPVHMGHIREVTGSLGAFTIAIDGFAPALPSARQMLAFEAPRNGFKTNCDLILDLSGGAPLIPGSAGRDGYYKADPRSPTAVAKTMFEIADMVGEFEKPLYVGYDEAICAHSRSTKVGCRNCLDNCPTGAISPNGDIVAIDPAICGGCGSCSAVCPTGAVSYAYPSRTDIVARIQGLARAYAGAGGTRPVLLLHDEDHGAGTIAMIARYGRGLPGSVLPLSLFSVFQTGHEFFASALASGFAQVVVLAPPDKPHDLPALEGQVALANAFATGLGHGDNRVVLVDEQDPDMVEARLHGLAAIDGITAQPFVAVGGKRDIARVTLAALNAAATEPRDVLALPQGAPYGRLAIDVENCTLCLACVGACPAGALSDDEARPRLSFTETACVQCGLCVATCPERVITLDPRYNFTASAIEPLVIKEEEPFECISCGKPFGTKSTVERIIAKLEGRHAMFQNAQQLYIIKMCDDCRVIAVSEGGGDPLTLGERPRVRTTDDYLRGDVGEDE